MTPSEPAASTGEHDLPLLAGHLHPAVLLLRLLDGLRAAVFPLLLGLLVSNVFLAFVAFLFLFNLGYGLARWLTFEYALTPTELRTREGILSREERRIPIDRVQDLGFESTILRRLLGITVVSVETASGKGAEAVLDSLGRAEAEQLREVLLRTRRMLSAAGHPGAATPSEAAGPEPEWTVFTARRGELLLRGCTDLRLGALLVSGCAALQVADQLGIVVKLRGVADSFFGLIYAFPLALALAVLAVLVAGVLAFSVLASSVGNWMVFHGFVLSLRGDTLLVRHGLLTRRQKTMPRVRVQRVSIEQSWLRRLVGRAVVYADTAGTGRGTGTEPGDGSHVVVPLTDLDTVQRLLPALLPGVPGLPADYRRMSPRLVWRVCGKGAVFAAALAAALWPVAGRAAAAALVVLPLGWLVGRLAFGNLGWQLGERHLFLRFGVLGRYEVVLPTGKVQAVVQRGGPLQQALGLVDLTVYVGGGSPTRLPDLPVADAAALQRELASRGGDAAAVEWSRKNPLPHSAPSA
jgi:putative membrane protein